MGRQVEFFMMPDEELAFLKDLGSRFDLVPMLTSWESDAGAWPGFWRPGGPKKDSQLCLIRKGSRRSLVLLSTPQESHRSIDLAASEAVEFDRCRISKGALINGRLWFDPQGDSGRKRPEFIAWADQVLRRVKKEGKRIPSVRYVFPKALKAAEEGRIRIEPDEPMSPDQMRKRLGLTKKDCR